LIFFCKVA